MEDDSFDLEPNSDYFYLFAMGRVPKDQTNVHLAVRHRPGSVASIGSAYGATFTIRDALALRVDRLPENWRGLPPAFTTCRNFQFGARPITTGRPEDIEHGVAKAFQFAGWPLQRIVVAFRPDGSMSALA